MRDVLRKLAALIENTEKDDQAKAVGD